MTWRVRYSVRLTGTVDFDAPDAPTASDAARDWLQRQYGTDLTSVWIEQTTKRQEGST